MTTFIISPSDQSSQQRAELDEIIKAQFGNKCHPFSNGWLVAYDGTSRQLSDALGISDGNFGSALVLNFSGHWGRAPSDLWEWIAQNQS